MVQQGPRNQGGRDRLIVNGLWLAAAVVVVAGFILRSLSSLLGRADFRLVGIGLIAGGLAMAVLGWVGDRLSARRAR